MLKENLSIMESSVINKQKKIEDLENNVIIKNFRIYTLIT